MATTITSNEGYNSSVSPDPTPEFKPSSFAENDSFEQDLLRPSIEAERKYQEEGLKIRRTNYETIKKHTLDFDNFEPEQTSEVRNRVLVSGYLDSQFRDEDRPSNDHDILRDSVAKHKFKGEGVGSDEAFVAAIRKDFEGENEKQAFYDNADRQALLSAYLGGGRAKKEFQDSVRGNPLAKSERREINERWKKTAEKIEEDLGASMLYDIRTTFEEMGTDDDWLMHAAHRTRNYSDEEKNKFKIAIRDLATTYPSEAGSTFGGNFGKSARRGVGGALDKGSEAAMEFFRNAGAGVHNVFVAPFAENFGSEETQEWSQQKRKDSAEWLRSERDAVDWMAELRDIQEGDFAPVKPLAPKDTSLQAIEQGIYSIPGALTTSAVAFIPVVGMPLSFGMMKEYDREKYRNEILANEGSRDDAYRLAGGMSMVSAVPNMLLEKFQSFGLAGKVPGMGKVFGKLDDVFANKVARFGSKMFVAGVAETTVELTQQANTDLVQDLTNSFKEFNPIVPDIEWKNGKDGHFDGYFNKTLTTFVAVAPLGVMVAGRGLTQERRAEAMKQASPLERKAFGITEEASAKLDEAKTPREMVAAFQNAVETREPFSDTAQESVMELEEMHRMRTQTNEDAETFGVSPSVRKTPEKSTFEVFDRLTGDTIAEVETAQEATEEVFEQLQMKEEESRHYFQELLASFEAAALDVEQSGEAVEVGTGTFTDADAEAAMPGSDRRLQTERELTEQRDGGTGAVAQEVMSEGQSGQIAGVYVPAGHMGRKEAVTQLHNSASVLTLIHERGHAKRRKLMESGAWTRADQISSLRELDNLIAKADEKFLPENFEELNEYDQEVALDEAIAELSESLALNSRKGKNSKMGGLITRNLSAMVKARIPGAAQLKSFLGSMRDFFGLQLRRATILRKAVRDGDLDQAQVDQLTDMLVGTNSQEVFEQERDAIPTQMVDGQQVDVPFSPVPLSIAEAGKILPGSEYISPEEARWATIDGPVVLGAYHGSTHTIERFSSERENLENDFGGGIYATTSPEDASANYAGEGPDLTSRIELRAEQIEQEEEMEMDEALEKARSELSGEGGRIYPLYLPMKNPAVIEEGGGTFFDPSAEIDTETLEFYREDSEAEIRDEYDLDEEASLDEYKDEVEERMRQNAEEGGEVTNPIYEAAEETANLYGLDPQSFSEALDEAAVDGAYLYQIEDAMRAKDELSYVESEDGSMIGVGEIINTFFQKLGYDGIIDRRANSKFGSERKSGNEMEGMDENTVHIIVPTDTANRPRSGFNPEVSFSPGDSRMLSNITPAQDAEYMEAVESGDVETQQEMVDARAKAAGYTSPRVFHGTDAEFEKFKANEPNNYRGKPDLKGIYFSGDINRAGGYRRPAGRRSAGGGKPRMVRAYLKMDNPLNITQEIKSRAEDITFGDAKREAVSKLTSDNDSVVFDGDSVNGAEYIVFNPNQIKSADPVTYDADGNVIPLSQRFDASRDEISFSPGDSRMLASITPAQDAAYLEAVESGDVETQRKIVDKAIKGSDYTAKGVRAGVYRDGVPLMPSRRGLLGSGFYAILDGKKEDVAQFASPVNDSESSDTSLESRVDDLAINLGDSPIFLDGTRGIGQYIRDSGLVKQFEDWLTYQDAVNTAYKSSSGDRPVSLESVRGGTIKRDLENVDTFQGAGFKSQNTRDDANFLLDRVVSAIVVDHSKSDGERDFKEVVVANPNQIKSAELVTKDSDGNVIPPSQRFNQSRGEISFSPGDSRMLSDLSENVMRRVRAPEARAVVFEQLVDRIDSLKRDVSKMIFGGTVEQEALPDARSMKSLKKEAAFRQASRQDELEMEMDSEMRTLGADLPVSVKDMPVHSALIDGGYKLTTKKKAVKDGRMQDTDGDFDNVGGLHPSVFGGDTMPDVAAQALAGLQQDGQVILQEGTVSELYDALAQEWQQVQENRQMNKDAKSNIRNTAKQARTEANEWLEEQVAKQKKYYNPVARIRRSLVMYDAILKTLPPELRGKMGGFVQIGKLNSDQKRLEFLEKKMEQLDVEVDKWISGKHRKQIDKIFKANKPKKKSSGQSKTDSNFKYADLVMKIQKLSKLTREEVAAKIEKIDGKLETETDEAEIQKLTEKRDNLAVFGNIDGMKANALGDFYQNLNAIHRQGKLLKAMSDEQFNQFLQETIGMVKEDVTGGQGEMTQSEAKAANEKRRERVIPARYIGAEDVKIDSMADFQRHNLSWEWIMNNISRANKAVGTLASETHKRLSTMVHLATHQESRVNMDTVEQYKEALAGIFGVKVAGQTSLNMDLTQSIYKMEEVSQTNISKMEYGKEGRSTTKRIPASKVQAILNGEATIEGLGISESDWTAIQARYTEIKDSGKSIKPNTRVEYESQTEGEAKMMSLSQSQAINLTMLWRQEGLKDSMEHEGYSDQTMKEMEEFLTPESKEIREWLTIQYEDNYHKINKVFRAQNGFSLPKTDFYSPAVRIAQKEAKDMSIDSEGRQAMSVDPNFTILRTTSRAPMDQTAGALDIYMSHALQTNHYVSWADTVKVLRSVFADQSVRDNIAGYVGRSALSTIDEKINWFADGGNRKAKHVAWLDKLRAAHTYGSLGFKWSIAVKQLTSLPAYAFDMSFKDFGKYLGLFLKGWKKNIKFMLDTPYVQNRLKSGYERDVIDGLRRDGGSKFMKALQVGMLSGKAGDIVPVIIGGWMARQRSYDNSKKAGMSEANALKQAEIDFEMITDRAQQAGNLKDLSSFKGGGSMFKLFSMYKTSPLQYYANVSETFFDAGGIKGLLTTGGKKDTKKDFARKFFIAQVMLPLTFQFASDLTKAPFRDDDEDKYSGENYLRAMLLGPLNGLFIAGDALEMIFSGVADTRIWAKKVPVLDGAQELAQGIGKMDAPGLLKSVFTDEDWDGDITGAADKIIRGMGRITPGAATGYDIIRDEIKRLEGVTEVFD